MSTAAKFLFLLLPKIISSELRPVKMTSARNYEKRNTPRDETCDKSPGSFLLSRSGFLCRILVKILWNNRCGAEQNILIFCVGDCFEIINHWCAGGGRVSPVQWSVVPPGGQVRGQASVDNVFTNLEKREGNANCNFWFQFDWVGLKLNGVEVGLSSDIIWPVVTNFTLTWLVCQKIETFLPH